MRKRVTVIERKLKRQRAVGQVFLDEGVIEIEPRQDAKDWLGTLIHEAVHCAFPEASERAVGAAEKVILDVLWRSGVRRIHLK